MVGGMRTMVDKYNNVEHCPGSIQGLTDLSMYLLHEEWM